MADAIVWPCDVLKPRNRQVDPVYRSVSGGVAVNGFSQVVASDAGIWKATFDGVWLRTADQVKTWRAIRSHAEGRLNPILLCVCEGTRRPILDGINPSEMGRQVPHSDDAFFSDNSGYISSWTDVSTSAGGALRAVTLDLIKTISSELEPGQRFSIEERLYEIKKIITQDDDSATIKIWPPLREFVPLGTHLEFDRPVLRVRLADDAAMDLPLELNRFSTRTIEFLEDL